MGGSSSKQTVGYKYYLGMHLVLCHGPVDKIICMSVDDRVALQGNFSDGEFFINQPELFGGEKKEGGVSGVIDINMGSDTQLPNAYLQSQLGNNIPSFRSVVSAIFRKFYLGNNPYLKPWSFRAQRIHTRQNGLLQWYDAKAQVKQAGEFPTSYDYDLDFTDPDYISVNITTEPEYVPPLALTINTASVKDVIGITMPGGKLFTAFKFSNIGTWPEIGWHSSLRVWPEGGEPFTIGELQPFETEEEARASFGTRDITGYTTYHFYLTDSVLSNVGGVSPHFEVISCRRAADMNPAHIIRECLTDPNWGMGYQDADLSDPDFMAAADTLYAEGMGMSLLWDRQIPIEEFIVEVVRHIDAVLYVDRRTGLFVLKLIRDDYAEGTLPEFNESNIQAVNNPSRVNFGELTNSVTVNYWNPDGGETASLSVQDTALAQMQGVVINTTLQYPGFTSAKLAGRVAMRDLKALSSPLWSCEILSDLSAQDLNPGDVFKLSWPDYSMDTLIMRVIDLNFGDGKSNRIKINATQDVFATPAISGLAELTPDEGWQDISVAPEPVTERLAIESPYYEVVTSLGQTTADANLADDPNIGYLIAAGGRPNNGSLNADVYIDSGAGYVDSGVMDFSPYAYLDDAVSKGQSLVPITGGVDLDLVEIGTHGQIGNELVRVDAISETSLTLGRGLLDTVPGAHPDGSTIIFWDQFPASDQTEYLNGELINVKLLTSSSQGLLSEADAPVSSISMNTRAIRPYPPGNVLVNTLAFPTEISGTDAVSLSWSHRDRLQQTSGVFEDYSFGNIGPEIGTTYNLDLYNELDVLVHSETGLSGTSFFWADEAINSGLIGGGADVNPAIPTDYVAFYKMNSIASGVLVDETGNFDGVVTGCAVVLGAIGNQVDFNGTTSDEILVLGGSLGLNDVFVSCFVEFDDVTAQGVIAGQWETLSSLSWILDVISGNVRMIQRDGASSHLVTKPVTTGVRYHIAAWSVDGEIGLSIDDAAPVTTSGLANLQFPNINLRFGIKGDSTGSLNGRIDQLRIYNYKLSPAQITDLANEDSSAFSGFRKNGKFSYDLYSVCDGHQSLYKQSHSVLRYGYGFNYGLYYGGK